MRCGGLLKSTGHRVYHFRFARGFATSRAASIKSYAAGLSVRFFKPLTTGRFSFSAHQRALDYRASRYRGLDLPVSVPAVPVTMAAALALRTYARGQG